MNKLNIFLKRYGFMGWVISIFVGACAVQMVVFLLFSIFGAGHFITDYLAMSPRSVWKMPWTLFSYVFVYEMSFKGVMKCVIDGMFLWGFGWHFHEILGREKLRKLLIITTPLLALIAILFSFVLNDTSTITSGAAVVIFLVFAVACFIPDMPIMLFGKFPLRLIFFAFLAVGVEISSHGIGAAGLSIIVAAILGYLYSMQIKKGKDWLEEIWYNIMNISTLFRPITTKIKAFFHKPGYKEPEITPPNTPNFAEISQEEIDIILDKISEKGYMSLTLIEREKLEKFAGRRKSDN